VDTSRSSTVSEIEEAQPSLNNQSVVMTCLEEDFSGKERDAESGLDYFGARYFSSPQGRFTSPDPLLNSGRPWEPQSWNRYSYVLNNPLRYVDPTGLYDYSTCDGSKLQCEDWRKRIDAGVTDARKALASENLTKKTRWIRASLIPSRVILRT
jgi:RHS repeat-associated protein